MKMELLIQKVCACCSSELLELFKRYLKDNNHSLSHSLIECIKKNPNQTIQFYCEKVYKNSNKEAIKKLNQLNHHTVKLFTFVSRNFPSFLWPTIQEIEKLIFDDKKDEASYKIKLLKEVADKFENYLVLIQLARIVNQHNGLDTNSMRNILKTDYLVFLNDIENLLQIQNNIIKENTVKKRAINEQELIQFQHLFNSKSKSVQILAKQSYLNVLSTCNHPKFYEPGTLKLINETIKEVEKYSYLLISQYSEKIMSLDYMLVKHTRLTLDEKAMHQACSQIIKKWGRVYSPNHQLDLGLTMAISIKGSYYITDHYFNKINKKLQSEIEDIILLCENLLHKIDWDKEGFLKYINLNNVYALYLILGNQSIKGAKTIETVLHEFQQKSFNKLYDGIFVILIMAYFQAKDYDMVIETFNRYKKLIKNDVSVIENDLIIKGLYYMAQIKLTDKKQYTNKLNQIVEALESDKKMSNNLQLIERVKTSIL